MRTIEAVATIEPDGKFIVQVPPDIPPGQHRVVIVIEELPIPVEKRPVSIFQ